MAILFILIILFIFVYFIPTFIASRGYQNVLLVFLINFLLGWTGIGWVVALILAFGTNTKKYEELKFRENEKALNEELRLEERSRHIKGLKEEDILNSADNRRVNEMKMKAEEYKLRAQIRAEVEEEMKKEKIRKQYEDELRDN
ncbi:superinfection immunity protein [Carnobacterium maltaromaticum]|uniref:superinfection immunity protein n=1 Tax=Carnobacterium maltaromaticum TaxID=2751 RepID=UPI0039BE350B